MFYFHQKLWKMISLRSGGVGSSDLDTIGAGGGHPIFWVWLYATGTILWYSMLPVQFLIRYSKNCDFSAVRKNWELRFGHDRAGGGHPHVSRTLDDRRKSPRQKVEMKVPDDPDETTTSEHETHWHLSLSDQFRGWIWNLQIPFILIRTLPVPVPVISSVARTMHHPMDRKTVESVQVVLKKYFEPGILNPNSLNLVMLHLFFLTFHGTQ